MISGWGPFNKRAQAARYCPLEAYNGFSNVPHHQLLANKILVKFKKSRWYMYLSNKICIFDTLLWFVCQCFTGPLPLGIELRCSLPVVYADAAYFMSWAEMLPFGRQCMAFCYCCYFVDFAYKDWIEMGNSQHVGARSECRGFQGLLTLA